MAEKGANDENDEKTPTTGHGQEDMDDSTTRLTAQDDEDDSKGGKEEEAEEDVEENLEDSNEANEKTEAEEERGGTPHDVDMLCAQNRIEEQTFSAPQPTLAHSIAVSLPLSLPVPTPVGANREEEMDVIILITGYTDKIKAMFEAANSFVHEATLRFSEKGMQMTSSDHMEAVLVSLHLLAKKIVENGGSYVYRMQGSYYDVGIDLKNLTSILKTMQVEDTIEFRVDAIDKGYITMIESNSKTCKFARHKLRTIKDSELVNSVFDELGDIQYTHNAVMDTCMFYDMMKKLDNAGGPAVRFYCDGRRMVFMAEGDWMETTYQISFSQSEKGGGVGGEKGVVNAPIANEAVPDTLPPAITLGEQAEETWPIDAEYPREVLKKIAKAKTVNRKIAFHLSRFFQGLTLSYVTFLGKLTFIIANRTKKTITKDIRDLLPPENAADMTLRLEVDSEAANKVCEEHIGLVGTKSSDASKENGTTKRRNAKRKSMRSEFGEKEEENEGENELNDRKMRRKKVSTNTVEHRMRTTEEDPLEVKTRVANSTASYMSSESKQTDPIVREHAIAVSTYHRQHSHHHSHYHTRKRYGKEEEEKIKIKNRQCPQSVLDVSTTTVPLLSNISDPLPVEISPSVAGTVVPSMKKKRNYKRLQNRLWRDDDFLLGGFRGRKVVGQTSGEEERKERQGREEDGGQRRAPDLSLSSSDETDKDEKCSSPKIKKSHKKHISGASIQSGDKMDVKIQ